MHELQVSKKKTLNFRNYMFKGMSERRSNMKLATHLDVFTGHVFHHSWEEI